MKKTYLFGMFAALALASCSSESEPAANNGNGNANEGEAQYLAVNICSPSGSGTRAGDTFEIGTTEENAVTSATFVLFKNNVASNVVTASQEQLTPWTENENNQNVARIAKAVLVLQDVSEASDYKIVTILNTTAPAVSVGTTSLSDFVETFGDYVTTATTENGKFIMSTSVYKNKDGDIMNYTAVSASDFAKSKQLAESKPVDIYVERVAAKATVSKGTNFVEKEQDITLNPANDETAVPTKLTLKILGIEIANIADKSNLVKSLTNVKDPNIVGSTTNATWADWNQYSLFRSYWAQNPDEVEYRNQSWNNIAAPDYTKPFYIQENAGNQSSQTAVLVKAQHVDENGNGYSFVRIAGEMYTPQGGLKTLADMFNSANFFVKTTDEDGTIHYNTLPLEAYSWVTPPAEDKKLEGVSESWEAYLTFDGTQAGGQIVKYDPKSTATTENAKYVDSDADAVNTELKKVEYRAWYWTEGKAYYFVNIKNEANVEGVVRNHVYKLALNDISGFGVPVFNPAETIIPKEPKDGNLFYLAARINVLQWKIEAQNVNFNHKY